MVKDIMKMAGVKSKKEFYAKYPTEESFLEAFPQAAKMFPQMAKGGATDEIAFPQAPVEGAFFNYGTPTINVPRLFQPGGQQDEELQEYYDSGKFWKNPITGQTIQEGARPTSSPIDLALSLPAVGRTLAGLGPALASMAVGIGKRFKYNPNKPKYYPRAGRGPAVGIRKKQEGGAIGDAMEEVINAVAQQLQIDPNEVVAFLQQNPEVMAQVEQLVAQDPNQAVEALMQVIQQAMGGEVSQEGQEMSPEEQAMMEQQAMQGQDTEMPPMMAYGGNPFVDSPLDRFVNGGSMLREYAEGGEDGCPCSENENCIKIKGGWKCEPKTNLERLTSMSPSEAAAAAAKHIALAYFSQKVPWTKMFFGKSGDFAKGKSGDFAKQVTKEYPKIAKAAGIAVPAKELRGVTLPTTGQKLARGMVLPTAYTVGDYLLSPSGDPYTVMDSEVPADATRVETPKVKVDTKQPPVYKLKTNVKRNAYGGGISVNPFNYGAYAPPMAYGGSNAPMGDTDYTPIRSERMDALMRFVQGGMQKAYEEEMMNYMQGVEPSDTMRRGGSKKKKG